MSEKTMLILLPAFMSTRMLWRPQIEALSDIAEIDVVELEQIRFSRGHIQLRRRS
jgi:hypothetical protein